MLPVIENMNTIEEMMSVLDQPMFLLDVHGEEQFSFSCLNRCHQLATGIDDSDVFGARPHEVFPERLADTIVQNYEHCRETKTSHTYEEVLELPSGRRWWQTTLSPIKDTSGQVIKILGLAVDITDRKDKEFAVSQKVADLTRLNEDLQVFAASSTRDMSGSFETIGALIGMVQEGFMDLGDEKAGQLALCQEIVESSIERMAFVMQVAEDLQVQDIASETVDLQHVAADIAALIDPHNRIDMQLPAATVETDRVALQMALRNLMENAVRYADSDISISVEEDLDEAVAFVVADDGVGQSDVLRCDGTAVLPELGVRNTGFGLSSAVAIVTSRGGSIRRVHSPYPTGAAIKFSLPGKVIH